MNYATYFPEQRHVLALTTIRRERLLPEGVIGDVEARQGERLDLRDVVARGALPARYLILDAMQYFRLKRPQDVDGLLLVEVGAPVEAGQVIAGRAGERGRKLAAPVGGVIAHVGDGRIIVQETPEPVEAQAGLSGQVIAVRERRGVVIETTGAVLQGVWGNNRLSVGPLRLLPEAGLAALAGDQLDLDYRGVVAVQREPLEADSFAAAAGIGISGLVAPSMSPALIDMATGLRLAVLLTEGFGARPMSSFEFSFLEALNGRQATIDAVTPSRDAARLPELIVNLPPGAGQRPPAPAEDVTLRVGLNVRPTRGEYAGLVGQIVHLPKTPYLLENGLRVFCAQVQFASGTSAFIPLANLEVYGQ